MKRNIGSEVANTFGELIRRLGLSHKSQERRNTKALRELTAVIYNSPTGYKTERGRFEKPPEKD